MGYASFMTDDSQQSPLDILEEILSKNKGSAATATAANEDATVDPAAPPVSQAAEEAAQLAEVRQQGEEQRQLDEVELQEQLQALQGVRAMPQYQARLQQQQEQEQEKAATAAELAGTEIVQLKRTKIVVKE